MRRLYPMFFSLALLALLSACSSTPLPVDAPRAVKVGKPYSISGTTYYPEYNPQYDEVGIASWYGPGFHGKKTANGETYDMHGMTAAHPTLPMPSLVRVTNLKNGQQVVVRINDRGPFKAGRIIDLSREASKHIDIHGIEKVRVEYLKEDTEQLWADMQLSPKSIAFAHKDKFAPDRQEIRDAQSDYLIAKTAQRGMSDSTAEVEVQELAPITSVSVGDIDDRARPPQKLVLPLQKVKYESRGFSIISNAEAASPLRPAMFADTEKAPVRSAAKAVATPEYQQRDTEALGQLVREEMDAEADAASEVAAGDSIEGYTVQVGAFSSEANAANLAQKLQPLGRAYVDTVTTSSGTTLYRVRIGPFANQPEAEALLHPLFERGIQDAAVTRP